jgi:hypothetical protein
MYEMALFYCVLHILFVIEQVASNKSSLILKIFLQNMQILQLLKMIKTEIILKNYLNTNLEEGLGGET